MPVIEYIGRKPFVTDRVAHSGKTWKGKGAVAEVTDAQATVLLKHPMEFRLAKGSKAPEKDELQATAESKSLDKFTAGELREYAKRKFGKDLKGKATADLLDQVRELEAEGAVVDPSINAAD